MSLHRACKRLSRGSLSSIQCIWAAVLLLLAVGSSHAAAAADGSGIARRLQAANSSSSPQVQQAQGSTSNTTLVPMSCWGWQPSCVGTDMSLPIFTLLGDSITAFGFQANGWATKLAQAYQGTVNVVDYGVEGATTRKVYHVTNKLHEQLSPHLQQIKLATVAFGANDAVLSHSPNWHLPLPQYKENLVKMVTRLQEYGIPRIIIITPPPVGRRRGDRRNNETKTYADTAIQVAQELKLEYVDIYSSIMAVQDWQDKALDNDHLHLSPVGQEVVYNSLMQVLAKSADVSPDKIIAAHKQQTQQQQPNTVYSAGLEAAGGMSDGQALKYVLGAAVIMLFVAVCTEAKKKTSPTFKKDVA